VKQSSRQESSPGDPAWRSQEHRRQRLLGSTTGIPPWRRLLERSNTRRRRRVPIAGGNGPDSVWEERPSTRRRRSIQIAGACVGREGEHAVLLQRRDGRGQGAREPAPGRRGAWERDREAPSAERAGRVSRRKVERRELSRRSKKTVGADGHTSYFI